MINAIFEILFMILCVLGGIGIVIVVGVLFTICFMGFFIFLIIIFLIRIVISILKSIFTK